MLCMFGTRHVARTEFFGGTSENLREQCLLAEGDLKKKRKKSLVQNAIFSPDFEAISKKRSSHLEDFVICEFWSDIQEKKLGFKSWSEIYFWGQTKIGGEAIAPLLPPGYVSVGMWVEDTVQCNRQIGRANWQCNRQIDRANWQLNSDHFDVPILFSQSIMITYWYIFNWLYLLFER